MERTEISLPIIDASRDQLTPADALISANVILRGGIFVQGVRRDIALFMDLCNLIEASVLHERLVCLPTGVPYGTSELGIIRALREEGVLWKLETSSDDFASKASVSILDYLPELSINDAGNLLKSITGRAPSRFDTSPAVSAFNDMGVEDVCLKAYPHIGMHLYACDPDDLLYRFLRAISYLSVANSLNVAYLPNFNRLAIVNPLLRHSVRNVEVNFLQKANDEIKRYVKTQEDRLRLAGRQIDLSIPPLASVVLDRARNKGIPDAILHTREEFSEVRQRFAKYAQLISSDECSIEESLKALDVLEDDLQTISEYADKRSSLRMLEWRPLATFVASTVDDPDELVSVKSWTDLAIRLLAMPLTALQSYIRRRRVQPLLRMSDKAQQVGGLSDLTTDVFSWKPSRKELEGLREFFRIVAQNENTQSDRASSQSRGFVAAEE